MLIDKDTTPDEKRQAIIILLIIIILIGPFIVISSYEKAIIKGERNVQNEAAELGYGYFDVGEDKAGYQVTKFYWKKKERK